MAQEIWGLQHQVLSKASLLPAVFPPQSARTRTRGLSFRQPLLARPCWRVEVGLAHARAVPRARCLLELGCECSRRPVLLGQCQREGQAELMCRKISSSGLFSTVAFRKLETETPGQGQSHDYLLLCLPRGLTHSFSQLPAPGVKTANL